MKFTTTIKGSGKLGKVAVISPPFDPAKVFNKKGRIAVRGTINGAAYRSSLFDMGGGYFMCLNRALCAAAGVAIGQKITVTMERDEAKRVVTVPAALKKIIAADKTTHDFWQTLSFTHQKEYVNWINDAKQDATRQRRIDKMMSYLKANKKKDF